MKKKKLEYEAGVYQSLAAGHNSLLWFFTIVVIVLGMFLGGRKRGACPRPI